MHKYKYVNNKVMNMVVEIISSTIIGREDNILSTILNLLVQVCIFVCVFLPLAKNVL